MSIFGSLKKIFTLISVVVFFSIFVFTPLWMIGLSYLVEPVALPDENNTSKDFVFWWVTNSIGYDDAGNKHSLSYNLCSNPKNTLIKGQGNCYEQSVLTCALMKYYGYNCWLRSYITIDSVIMDSMAHMVACTTDFNGKETCTP